MRRTLYDSISRLSDWLEQHEYKAYDPFDGLNAKLLRPLTFNNKYLRMALQQGVRRFPLNLRPLLGIPKSHSTKGMGFLARAFLRLHDCTGDSAWKARAESALQWLTDHKSPGYSGACWGNHFDYQSRVFYLPRGVPTVVWCSLIGHAFLDAYDQYQDKRYLNVAISSCEHIMHDLDTYQEDDAVCISYIPTDVKQVHNANTLGAGLLARTYSHCRTEDYRSLAERAIRYTVRHQRNDSSWYYGEAPNLHWIDNFHTAYVLDSIKHYTDNTGDCQFLQSMIRGYRYWLDTFFLADGTPKYYSHQTLPVDIQCCSQAIDTMVLLRDYSPNSIPLAKTVAKWTLENMQDRSGYFYFRRYRCGFVNKTAMLHWGQATMLCALSGLYKHLSGS